MSFLLEAVTNILDIGAVCPFSDTTAILMCTKIKKLFDGEPKHIAELGGGTGTMTKIMLDQFSDARIATFEINPKFIDILRAINNDRLDVYDHSAVTFGEKIGQQDMIVSTIPLTFLGPDQVRQILSQSYDILSPGGCLVIIQYMPFYRKNFAVQLAKFRHIDTTYILRNMPPCFIDIYTKSP